MKILITGGAGFLGYHLANRIARENHEIILLDIANFNQDEYPRNVRLLNGDIRDKQLLSKLMTDLDIVIHAAGALPLWSRKEIFSVNIEGTRNVLECAQTNRVKRVIFISSTAVYGIPEKSPIYEDDPLIEIGPYGESKIAAEKICLEFRIKGMCVPIVRPKTFIGTGRMGIFQILFDWVQNNKRIPIIGTGKNKYQLLEVVDLADAILLCATKNEEKANDTFNVGAKYFGTVKDDVGALCKFAGGNARVLKTPAGLIKFFLKIFERLKLSPLYEWSYGTADKDNFVSIDKIEHKLGWTPKHSNSEALIKSYKWYLNHYREIKNEGGITHRAAWKQGILGFFKRFM